MKFKVIAVLSMVLGFNAYAQTISNFDVNKEFYMSVTEQKGQFTTTKEVTIDEAVRLQTCKITFYFEDSGALQQVISLYDQTRTHEVIKYGLYLEASRPFPLREGVIDYYILAGIFNPNEYSLGETTFDGALIESIKGDLKRKKYYSNLQVTTDEYLNIQKYMFKSFALDEHGVMIENLSFTCETPPMS